MFGLVSLLILILLSFSPISALARDKTIRLRNEAIVTPDKGGVQAAGRAATSTRSRLHLIQFEGRVETAWRKTLEAQGVKLLSYVPEDTFIADLNQTPPGQVRSLPFVRWIGRYRPEHKIHGHLQAIAPARAAAGEAVDVSILLAPRAEPAEEAQVRNLITRLGEVSRLRQGTILKGRLPATRLQQLAESDAVLWVESTPQIRLYDEESSKIMGGDDGVRGTPTVTQQLGYDGSGVVVAVADSGLDSGDASSMHPDLAGRVDAIQFYGTLTDGSDEHGHGTHVAGIVAGNAAAGETDESGALYGLGVAPGAHIVSQRIFDGAGGYTYPHTDFEPLTRDALNAGADIGSNSWGDDTQGRYDLSAMQFDALVRDANDMIAGDQPYILEFSAGNAGPGGQTIGSPAVAKNVIATGATENNRFNLPLPEFSIYASGQETMADFSSRGPCEDGRIKPDVVAPGTWIASLRSVFANDDFAWWPISDTYMYQGGTSQAGPGVSGAAAVFVQYYRFNNGGQTPSPALVKAALINSAVDMDDDYGDTGPVPNMDEGWGRVDLTQLIDTPLRHEFVDQSAPLTNNQVYEQHVVVADPSNPLKITVTYTDVPGMPAAIPALVNDLDLEVLAPDGQLYRGNYFAGGDSAPGAVSGDRINNVEGVHFQTPLAGQYVIRVRGHNVVEDALTNTAAIDQDFALVISGLLLLPGESLVAMDQNTYTAPSGIRLAVVDPDEAAAPSVSVTLTSTTEPGGEMIILMADGITGVFTGVVTTATGGATTDGQLQIAHNDAIHADYFDVSSGMTRSVLAQGDLVPPVLTGVSSAAEFGTTAISWQSDEPATAIVRYGTNATLSTSITNQNRTTVHSISLEGLIADVTYFFHVSGADEAGNVATNDNSGSLHSFVAPTAATVLFVDGYIYFSGLDETSIPRSAYTDAISQAGVSHEVWDISELGSPSANDLATFRVVVWRLSSSLWWSFSDYSGLNPAEQSALQAYLDNDGALLLSSMEVLSQIGPSAAAQSFRSNVLHVVDFAEDAGVDEAAGVASDSVSSGMSLPLDYSAYDDSFLDWDPNVTDTLTVSDDATPIFLDDTFGDIAGLRYPRIGQDSTGRVVFLSFPFDTVSGTDSAPNNRANLMRNVLSFLAPGADGIGTIALDRSAYTIPGLITVEVADSDLEGNGTATTTFYSDTDPSGVIIQLSETVRPGLFRGTLTLVPSAATPGPGQLRTAEGDTIRAEYFDVSNNGIVQAVATVDTTPPVITMVDSEPGYQDAIITWQTTEPADTLVQFGESPLLERTAYGPALTTDHEIVVTGLLPARLYYFQTTSRDPAGNATTITTNASGTPLTLTTLTPIPLPWSDDMETGATQWEVVDLPDTELSWTLGPPNNGLESQAHSPVNVWGSNRNGVTTDLIESALVSPAIDLTSATDAELRFWHSHAFSEDIFEAFEYGVLELYTDPNGLPVTLFEYQGSSSGWDEKTFDLTPYVGNVVYLAWHYVYFRITFDQLDSPGWLVDDVSVTGTFLTPGTIRLTNNLAQAAWTLTGPSSRTGSGMSAVYSNSLPGQYSVAYNPVPWHETPGSHSNSLVEAGTLAFTGNYSFIDTNSNNISDTWEQSYFAEVSPSRDCDTDTDGDGFPDCSEFTAGTNPTNATSHLYLTPTVTLPNGNLRVTWPSVAGRIYRLESSSSFATWTPLSDWLQAATNQTGYTFPAPTLPTMFRIEVKP